MRHLLLGFMILGSFSSFATDDCKIAIDKVAIISHVAGSYTAMHISAIQRGNEEEISKWEVLNDDAWDKGQAAREAAYKACLKP